jgi:hypothetical protein
MIGKKCCCDLCSCLGCVRVVIDGVALDVPEGEPYDTFHTAVYNGTRAFWQKSRVDRSPFDLMHNGGAVGDCTSEAEAWPGTLCVMTANACCAPSVDDDVEAPDSEEPPPPPPP